MISIPIRDMSGADCGVYEFDPASLVDGINKQLLHDVVVMYAANRRVGTVQTKSRGMVAGSTRKIFRQKGTGRARMGPVRTPIRRGGGHAFGKKPRDYSYRLPKKAVRKASRMALLSKFQDDQAFVLKEWDCPQPQTRVIANTLKSLGLSDASCLIAVGTHDPVLWKSARNIPTVRMMPVSDLNADVLLRQRNLLITVDGLDRVLGRSAAAGESSTSDPEEQDEDGGGEN